MSKDSEVQLAIDQALQALDQDQVVKWALESRVMEFTATPEGEKTKTALMLANQKLSNPPTI